MKKTLKNISLSFLASAFIASGALAANYDKTGAEDINKNTASNVSYHNDDNDNNDHKGTYKKKYKKTVKESTKTEKKDD